MFETTNQYSILWHFSRPWFPKTASARGPSKNHPLAVFGKGTVGEIRVLRKMENQPAPAGFSVKVRWSKTGKLQETHGFSYEKKGGFLHVFSLNQSDDINDSVSPKIQDAPGLKERISGYLDKVRQIL